MKNNKLFEKYADLIITKGVNIQPKQKLYIFSPVELYPIMQELVEIAYKHGAGSVVVNYSDENLKKLSYEYQDLDTFSTINQWVVDRYSTIVEEKAALLKISGNNPTLFQNSDPEKMILESKTFNSKLKGFQESQMKNHISWSIAAFPTLQWAKQVFPKSETPVDDLWAAIFKVTKVDEDSSPITNWDNHIERLNKYSDFLNSKQFKSLKFKNDKGTDLHVGLVQNHIWNSAESMNEVLKNNFIANIPSEEVFTMPHALETNGIVYSTKPLNHQGVLIEDFWIKFENGKAVDFDAKKGKQALSNIINFDKNSCRIGEVAIVDNDSPISNSNITFFNTLFDENASCHLALGQAYSFCIENADQIKKEDREAIGFNTSDTHVDFMFGDSTMNIIAIDQNNNETLLFENGNFVL